MEKEDEQREMDYIVPNTAELTGPPAFGTPDDTANKQYSESAKSLHDSLRNTTYKMNQTPRPVINTSYPTENSNNQCMTQPDPNVVYTNKDENAKSDSSIRTRYWYPNNSVNDFKYTPTQNYRSKRHLGYTPSPIERQYYEFRERQMASVYSSESNTNNSAKYNFNNSNRSHNVYDTRNSKQMGTVNMGPTNYEHEPIPAPTNSMNMYYNYPKMINISYGNSNNTCYGVEENQFNAIDEFEEISTALKRATLETVYQTSNPFFRNPSPEEWVVKLLEVDREFKNQFRHPDKSIWNSQYYVHEQSTREPLYMFFDEDFKIWKNPPPDTKDTHNETYQPINNAYSYYQLHEEKAEETSNQLPKENYNKAGSYYQLHEAHIDEASNYQQPKTQADEVWRYQMPKENVNKVYNYYQLHENKAAEPKNYQQFNKTCRYQLPGEQSNKACTCVRSTDTVNKAYNYQLFKEQPDESYRYQLPNDQLNNTCNYQLPKEQVTEACSYQLRDEQVDEAYGYQLPGDQVDAAQTYQNNFGTSKPEEWQYWNQYNQNQAYVKPVFYYCNDDRPSQEVLPVFYYYNFPWNFYPMSSFKPDLEYEKQNQTNHTNPSNYHVETNIAQPGVDKDNNNNKSGFEKSGTDLKGCVQKPPKSTDCTQDDSKTQNINKKQDSTTKDQKCHVKTVNDGIPATKKGNSKILVKKNAEPAKPPERQVKEPLRNTKTQCVTTSVKKVNNETTNHKNKKATKENKQLEKNKKSQTKTRIFNSKVCNEAVDALQPKSNAKKPMVNKKKNIQKSQQQKKK